MHLATSYFLIPTVSEIIVLTPGYSALLRSVPTAGYLGWFQLFTAATHILLSTVFFFVCLLVAYFLRMYPRIGFLESETPLVWLPPTICFSKRGSSHEEPAAARLQASVHFTITVSAKHIIALHLGD